jgi:transposase
MTTSTILAIDLGKYNSVACHYEPETKATTFRTIRTTPDEMRKLLARQPVKLVVLEACSASGWVTDLCQTMNLNVAVANTAGEAWKWMHVKRKTDHDDALKLARLAAMNELPTVPMPPKEIREWKSLIGLRKRLVGERVRSQNRLRALLVSQGLSAPVGAKAWSAKSLSKLDSQAKTLADCSTMELWRGELFLLLERYRFLVKQIEVIEQKLDGIGQANARVRLIETMPGMGPRTAEVIVCHLVDAKRFRSADEVSAYAGMIPRQYQSGQTDRRGACTKRGPKMLRSALVEVAWCSIRYNSWAKLHWLHLTEENGVSRKKAVVALGRKLLVRCWGMLKTETAWQDPLGLPSNTTPGIG